MGALPDLRQHRPTLPDTGSATHCHERCAPPSRRSELLSHSLVPSRRWLRTGVTSHRARGLLPLSAGSTLTPIRSVMLAPPAASLPNEKRVLAHASLNTPPVYPDTAAGLDYIFLAIAFHLYGPAHYIFFASTFYLFGDHISPRSQLYWEQREERKGTCLKTQPRGC